VVSIIGLLSVAVSGGLGLLKLDPFWFAVKEAAIPLAIGTVIVGSQFTPRPLVRAFLLNPDILDTERLDRALEERGSHAQFQEALARCTWMLGGLFLMSAALNFALARYLIRSQPGTEAFSDEFARMNVWSFGVIVAPMMIGLFFAMNFLLGRVQGLTGIPADELIRK
jgi:hypothetical protein